jgi:hypothetical protein
MSSMYHPQSNVQSECVNQCMKTFLRCFVNACPKKWINWLSLTEYWYNTSYHSSIGTSPFEAMYIHPPRHFGLLADIELVVTNVSQWLQHRQVMTDLIKQHLNRAIVRMKHQTDKKHSERQFQVGDLVLLKLQSYVQSSLAPHANQKLAFKYFGSFPVLQRIGMVAYKLGLPQSSTIHPVFHVSQLRPVVGASVAEVSSSLPSDAEDLHVPKRILQKRVINRRLHSVPQVLVKWSTLLDSLATWEDMEDVKQRFPQSPAWGQAGFKGRDIVTVHDEEAESWRVGTEKEAVEEELVPLGRCASLRVKKPNPKVIGPTWR